VQLADILELVAGEGVRRYVEKRAGVLLPLAVGAMIPSIVSKAMDRSSSFKRNMQREDERYQRSLYGGEPRLASWGSSQMQMPWGGPSVNPYGAAGAIGGALGVGDIAKAPARGIAGGLSQMVQNRLFGQQMGERKDLMGMAGTGASQAFGKEMGTAGAKLLLDIANKAMETASHLGDSSARDAIISNLKRTDSVLMNADDKTLMEAYHTMTRFAPVLSTDKNAVRSFLRQAVMSGSGPDYMSIKLLADSERAVTGDKDHR
jgi:hypothetical protein